MSIFDMNTFIGNCKVYDLSHEVSDQIPKFDLGADYYDEVITTVAEDGFCVKRHHMNSQFGTHIDVENHFFEGGMSLDQVPINQFILPLYVINKVDEVGQDPNYSLTKEDIIAYEDLHGSIPEKSFVAFASGWSKRWTDHENFYNKDSRGVEQTPGWSKDALEYLHLEKKVTAIGHETLNTDRGVDIASTNEFISQSYWLSTGKYQIEVMKNLWQLPVTGSLIFIGVSKIEGATGFNARVLALVPQR